MSRIVVRRNDLPRISRGLDDKMVKAVEDMGDDLAELYRETVWVLSGEIKHAITWDKTGKYRLLVKVGFYLGRGFYSGFPEFGTVHQGSRPVVRPGAHSREPVFADKATKALQEACGA